MSPAAVTPCATRHRYVCPGSATTRSARFGRPPRPPARQRMSPAGRSAAARVADVEPCRVALAGRREDAALLGGERDAVAAGDRWDDVRLVDAAADGARGHAQRGDRGAEPRRDELR